MTQRPDVIALRQFYSSSLGRKVKQRLRQLLLEYWPETADETILGIGYVTPLLRVLERTSGKRASLAAAMPAAQGAIYWPVHADNRSFLIDEIYLPLRDNSVNRVIMLHTFEHCNEPEKLLAECYRILVPGGRVMMMVPNRRGLWQSLGETPYAQGTPYRTSQLKQLLNTEEFTLREVRTALFALPFSHPLLLRIWDVWERFFGLICWGMGGVIIIEAEKQIYAAIPEPVFKKVKQTNWSRAAAPVA
jgi:SAM-dependent methyltransferase